MRKLLAKNRFPSSEIRLKAGDAAKCRENTTGREFAIMPETWIREVRLIPRPGLLFQASSFASYNCMMNIDSFMPFLYVLHCASRTARHARTMLESARARFAPSPTPRNPCGFNRSQTQSYHMETTIYTMRLEMCCKQFYCSLLEIRSRRGKNISNGYLPCKRFQALLDFYVCMQSRSTQIAT